MKIDKDRKTLFLAPQHTKIGTDTSQQQFWGSDSRDLPPPTQTSLSSYPLLILSIYYYKPLQ